MAARHPELVGGIVSLEGGMVDRFASPGLSKAAAMAPLLRFLGAAGIVRRRVGSSLRERSANGRWVTNEVVDVYSRSLVKDTQRSLTLLRSLANAREPTPIDEEARAIHVPVLLLIGDAQQPSGPGKDEIARMRAAMPSFRVETIANAGHFLHEEQPGAVVEHILLIDRESHAMKVAGATRSPD
jgi:pimeloyl-ACP methyl ester carboxylesterase